MNNNITNIVGAVVIATLVAIGIYGVMYFSSPAHIRHPQYDHYHFRTQIIVDGKAVDFSTDKYQQEYDDTSCDAEVGETPIDFHDNEDQMTHVHWDGMTGGEFLKYFGWNFINGDDSRLGRRYDMGPMSMHPVSRFGDVLPEIPQDSNFYVYIGDEDGYTQKSWSDFLSQDLEVFFGKQSNINVDQSMIKKLFVQKALAHGGVKDGHETTTIDGEEKTKEELLQINNLIGNVVIFVQKEEPTEEQIQERFDNLAPLHLSTCGG